MICILCEKEFNYLLGYMIFQKDKEHWFYVCNECKKMGVEKCLTLLQEKISKN